jgi:catechol 2,3-dioxygenase-like lactoylglutathione lyase family enzyme
MGESGDGFFWADELFVSTPESKDARGILTGRQHFAFQAQDRAMVDAFYNAALAHGGKDNGVPGERVYHPGYYAAFVLDPDGNNISLHPTCLGRLDLPSLGAGERRRCVTRRPT